MDPKQHLLGSQTLEVVVEISGATAWDTGDDSALIQDKAITPKSCPTEWTLHVPGHVMSWYLHLHYLF